MPLKLDQDRTLDQNALMWCRLRDISRQVEWPVNGRMSKMAPEDWKDLFTAELKKEQRIAAGLSGGFVLLGCSTRKLKKRELSDVVELLYAFGAEHDVKWTENEDEQPQEHP